MNGYIYYVLYYPEGSCRQDNTQDIFLEIILYRKVQPPNV